MAPSAAPVQEDLPFSGFIRDASLRHGVSQALIAAVAHAESGFNPRAVSPAGAMGLMQLMPGTAARLGVTDPWDAEQNIDGGTRYLADALRRYDGDLRLVLQAYNAGPGAVDRFNGDVPYEETRRYVGRVLSLYETYRQAYGEV